MISGCWYRYYFRAVTCLSTTCPVSSVFFYRKHYTPERDILFCQTILSLTFFIDSDKEMKGNRVFLLQAANNKESKDVPTHNTGSSLELNK